MKPASLQIAVALFWALGIIAASALFSDRPWAENIALFGIAGYMATSGIATACGGGKR